MEEMEGMRERECVCERWEGMEEVRRNGGGCKMNDSGNRGEKEGNALYFCTKIQGVRGKKQDDV